MKWLASLLKWHALLIFAPLGIYVFAMMISLPLKMSTPTYLAFYFFSGLWAAGAYLGVKAGALNAQMMHAEGDKRMELYDRLIVVRKRYFFVWIGAAGSLLLFAVIGVLTGDLQWML